MQNLNEEFIAGWDGADKNPKKPFVPWAIVEQAAQGMTTQEIDAATAQKMIAERELAYKYNEGYLT
jgi:hypothetical protein